MTDRCFGVLGHPTRSETEPVTERIGQTLKARGFNVWMFPRWTPEEICEVVQTAELVIAIGGDGAMLRASRVCADFGVPVLGVNMGYLGFLTEIRNPDDWDAHLDQVVNRSYWIETRMMIHARVVRDEMVITEMDALNDVVISRGNVPRMIRLDMFIDRDWTTTYNADALIVSTATGSTAYALASGGPILPPELRNILVVPVAPHLSLDRPIVLPEGAQVEIIVSPTMLTETVLSADGLTGAELRSGDHVVVQASDLVCKFARIRERTYFYRSLLDRLEPRPTAPTEVTPHKL